MRRTKHVFIIGSATQYDREACRGIQAYCDHHEQWEFHLEPDPMGSEVVRRLRVALRQWKADGIIAPIRSDHVEKLIRSSGLPAVNISGFRKLKMPTVTCDDVAVGQLAARHFLGNGFKNFGFVALNSRAYVYERYAGFADELAKGGFACQAFRDQYTGADQNDWVRNSREMDRWLLTLPKPVAISCIHDLRAMEVAWACRRLGLRVPDDVAIVGTGNEQSICRMCAPPLSTVELDIFGIGYESARLLGNIFKGAEPSLTPVLVPPSQLITRQSSDLIAIDDMEVVSALRHIRSHAHEPITVKDLLAEVHICRKTMELRFMKLLGRTPGAELAHLRLKLGRRLLEETNLLIPEVAHRSGFTSAHTFTAFFRRKMRMPPTTYRHKMQGARHPLPELSLEPLSHGRPKP
jgi:LacI family transcriptional regulator